MDSLSADGLRFRAYERPHRPFHPCASKLYDTQVANANTKENTSDVNICHGWAVSGLCCVLRRASHAYDLSFSVLITCVLRMVYSLDPDEPETGESDLDEPATISLRPSNLIYSAIILTRNFVVHHRAWRCTDLSVFANIPPATDAQSRHINRR